MKRHGITANDEILYAIVVHRSDKIFEVRAKVHNTILQPLCVAERRGNK